MKGRGSRDLSVIMGSAGLAMGVGYCPSLSSSLGGGGSPCPKEGRSPLASYIGVRCLLFVLAAPSPSLPP